MRAAVGALVGLAALVATEFASAQSYGPHDQVLTIGAAGFRPEMDDHPGYLAGAFGYLFYSGAQVSESPTNSYHRAAVTLPAGAHLTRLCMWVYDATVYQDLSLELVLTKLTYGGEDPAELHMAPLSSELAPGFRSYCEDLDLTITPTYDVDGDSNPDPVTWFLRLSLPSSTQQLAFGGAQITWSREVSEAPATPTFNDVPVTQPFFQFIEALHDSGITNGCGTDIFCPDAPLTRGQMAAFLSKALGLYWPN